MTTIISNVMFGSWNRQKRKVIVSEGDYGNSRKRIIEQLIS